MTFRASTHIPFSTSNPVVPQRLISHATILGKSKSLIGVVLPGGAGHSFTAHVYLAMLVTNWSLTALVTTNCWKLET